MLTSGKFSFPSMSAAPQRARQLGKKTPCAVKLDRCYDCKSPDRICRGMVTLWGPMMGMDTVARPEEEVMSTDSSRYTT